MTLTLFFVASVSTIAHRTLGLAPIRLSIPDERIQVKNNPGIRLASGNVTVNMDCQCPQNITAGWHQTSNVFLCGVLRVEFMYLGES